MAIVIVIPAAIFIINANKSKKTSILQRYLNLKDSFHYLYPQFTLLSYCEASQNNYLIKRSLLACFVFHKFMRVSRIEADILNELF